MELHYASHTLEANTPAALPTMRDLAELVRDHLPGPLVQLVPLPELERRCEEINLTMPRFREETPLVLRYERTRRQKLTNPQPSLAS
ncbi:hypothetical protein [Hymenobacter crusticola]|uniref:Uncharacterized protein n=1 Tax=Hymenobacter crusticola TaxID=1770526 RepID=A0A243W5S1_9BACT|nr:hypothetical protein [Hymenobacter crusticola]OUJ68600.1 hypothetical protein BXP70_27780 [Hymenobacter crusticola]